MTNEEIIRLLAPAFHDKVQQIDFLDPFEDFSIPVELVPISAETLQQWRDEENDDDKLLAIKFATFVADILQPAVE